MANLSQSHVTDNKQFQQKGLILFNLSFTAIAMTQPTGFLQAAAPFAIGGLSGVIASAIIQPIDTLKVQFQVISQQLGKQKSKALSLPSIVSKIHQEYGLSSLYRGLDSAILRQIFYASARIGAYETSVVHYQKLMKRKASSLQKVVLSMVSGAFGALIGNPFDVALIRRQASISNNANYYKNTFDAFSKIVQQEGFLSLWRGLNITIWRVILINFGQLAGKDIISEQMTAFQLPETIHQNLTALLASILTAVISLPVDNIKVKLQKQDNTSETYRGILHCFSRSIANEGILRLWVGFPIYLLRGAPHSFIIIRSQYLLTQKWKKLNGE